MSNPTPPYILEESTPYPDVLARVNDNFKNLVQDVGDLGVSQRTNSLVITKSLTVLNIYYGDAGVIIDDNNVYPGGIGNITGRIAIYMDVDNDAAHLWPLGSAFSGFSVNPPFDHYFDISPVQYTSTGHRVVGSFTFGIVNQDSADHTFFLHMDFDYLPTKASGFFR
jgi:hypothetical protein